jgi:hypothetical protein
MPPSPLGQPMVYPTGLAGLRIKTIIDSLEGIFTTRVTIHGTSGSMTADRADSFFPFLALTPIASLPTKKL